MTRDQKIKFNRMYNTLRKIAHGYMSPEKMKEESITGLPFEQELELAYENIQTEAEGTIKDIQKIK